MGLWTTLPYEYNNIEKLTEDEYGRNVERGDIGFYLQLTRNGYMFGHTILVGASALWVIHSVEGLGVYSSSLNLRKKCVFFRFTGNPAISYMASEQAMNWSRGRRYHGDYRLCFP